MTLQHSHAIFNKILEDFTEKGKVGGKDSQKVLEKRITSSGPMRYIYNNFTVVYKKCGWSSSKGPCEIKGIVITRTHWLNKQCKRGPKLNVATIAGN